MQVEYATLSSPNSAVAPVLQAVSASGTLEGLLLAMTLRQVFRNDSDENLEVVYTFPLAWGAVLTQLAATLGGKRMHGQVLARAEARERYEDAIGAGAAPIMVEKAQNGVYSAMLGSLKPGEEAIVELSYAQLLAFEQGRIRLVVPTTLAPRYGDAVVQGGLAPHQVASPDLLVQHGFGLSLVLRGSIAQACIGSPTHTIRQQHLEDAVRVTLQDGSAWLDRDFVLLLENLPGRSYAIAGPDQRDGERSTALIASYYPVLPQTPAAGLRMKILVDCSGSMAGDSMAQALNALRPLAALLKPQDKVSYSRFGSHTQHVLPAREASPSAVEALLQAINATHASLGGTELARALQDTFDLPMKTGPGDEQADVLLITDGEVWDIKSIVDAASRSGHRIYALGVGSAPAESLLRELAEATGGACEFATPRENMAVAMQRLLKRLQLAIQVDAKLDLQEAPLWCSPLPQRLIPDETVHMFLRLPVPPTRAPALLLSESAEQAGLCWREDDLVARLVAEREINLTVDTARASALAERYQLVTEHSNLLLVFERADADKTDGMPALHPVRPMLAAGWGGVGRTPQDNGPVFSRRCAAKVSPGLACSDMPLSYEPYLHMPDLVGNNQIVAVFNEAVDQGLSFRQALREVSKLALSFRLERLIDSAAVVLRSPLNAWACFLLWLHGKGDAELQLNPAALALVMKQVAGLDHAALDAAREQIFSLYSS